MKFPVEMPVTSPSELTLATLSLLLMYVTSPPGAVAFAASSIVSPLTIFIIFECAHVSVWSYLVTVNVLEIELAALYLSLPACATVIVAVPAPTAVIWPLLFTVKTLVLSELYEALNLLVAVAGILCVSSTFKLVFIADSLSQLKVWSYFVAEPVNVISLE